MWFVLVLPDATIKFCRQWHCWMVFHIILLLVFFSIAFTRAFPLWIKTIVYKCTQFNHFTNFPNMFLWPYPLEIIPSLFHTFHMSTLSTAHSAIQHLHRPVFLLNPTDNFCSQYTAFEAWRIAYKLHVHVVSKLTFVLLERERYHSLEVYLAQEFIIFTASMDVRSIFSLLVLHVHVYSSLNTCTCSIHGCMYLFPGALFGGASELLYSQFELHTREEKSNQIVLLEVRSYSS